MKDVRKPVELIRGNCLEWMASEVGKYDMLLCDLPYGTTQNKWDTPIDLAAMRQGLRKIMQPSAALVFFAAQPSTSALVMSNPKMFKYDWVWHKPKGTGHLNVKKMPMRDKEDILVFYGEQPTYNPQFTEGKPYKDKAGKDHSKSTSMTGSYGAYTNYREDNPGRRYPKQVLDFGVVERGTLHPTQKPEDLCAYLIKTYTNEKDRVLDITMGSGSTGAACLGINREFTGIELDEKYFATAKARLGVR